MTQTTTVYSSVLVGLEPRRVRIDVTVTDGPGLFSINGLTFPAAKETRIRVAAALAQAGMLLHNRSIAVQIIPDVHHGASTLDLAIAVGIVRQIEAIDGKSPAGVETVNALAADNMILGELSLSGDVRPVRGVLAHLERARYRGFERAIVPVYNRAEAAIAARDLKIDTASSLAAILDYSHPLERIEWAAPASEAAPLSDFADIPELPAVRRALEIAAAGNHNILLIGPPGAGITMLARRMAGILPPLTEAEANEVTRIHSVAGLLGNGAGRIASRPFRAPHHTVSEAGLVGGGEPARPGEVSLAHNGVLLLDEMPEFRKAVLGSLSGALAEGRVNLVRRGAPVGFPARAMVVATMHACPCGYAGDASNRCACSPDRVLAYLHRISGPILDQIDLRIRMPVRVPWTGALGESSATVRARVVHARTEKAARDVARTHVEQGSPIEPSRLYRVARTIADLDHSTVVLPKHREEAVELTQHLDRVQVLR